QSCKSGQGWEIGVGILACANILGKRCTIGSFMPFGTFSLAEDRLCSKLVWSKRSRNVPGAKLKGAATAEWLNGFATDDCHIVGAEFETSHPMSMLGHMETGRSSSVIPTTATNWPR